MTMIAFNLPYPPSVNTYWRHVSIKGKRRTLISERGRDYRDDVCHAIGKGVVSFNHPIAVVIEAYMPDHRIRDLDNIPKAILDALTHAGVWPDDNIVDDLRIIRRGVEKPGRVIVTIKQI